MLSKREIQSINNNFTFKKVKIVYELLCDEDIMQLVDLFTNENLFKEKPNYRSNRKKWAQKLIAEESVGKDHLQKEYELLKISRLYMDDKIVFDKDVFFGDDLDAFRDRVEEYAHYLRVTSFDVDMEYKYIYLYDENLKKLVYYHVEYAAIHQVTSQNSLMIKVYSSKDDGVEYRGSIEKRKNKIVLVFENSYDMIHIIFNALLTTNHANTSLYDNYYGLAIGIDDQNQQTPVAKKVVFSKKIFDEKEKEQLYLILNETQTLEAKESLYALEAKSTLDADHVGKYYQNIKDMHTFFSNIKYSKIIKTSIMHHMVFTEFHVYQKMFEKFSSQQDYFLRDRKRVCLEFIRFLQSATIKKVMLSLPIFIKKDNIFFMETYEKKSMKTLFVELAQKGVVIEIVFVVQERDEYENRQIRGVLKELNAAGVKIYFVIKKEIEKSVSSYDFCCMKDGIDAIFKSKTRFKEMFTITRNREQIKNLMIDFQNIVKKSYNYEDVKSGKFVIGIENPILKKLIGKWYLYFYGSYTFQDGTPVFWDIEIEVRSDFTVVEFSKNNSLGYGRVEVFKKMVLFSVVSAKTDNTFYMVVNTNKISDVISVMVYSKQDQKDIDMAMIGVASREKLMKEEAQNLLGESKNTVLKTSPMLQVKIDEFILAHKIVKS